MQLERKSPTTGERGRASGIATGKPRPLNFTAADHLRAIQNCPVDDSPLPPARMLDHCADVIEVIMRCLCRDEPVSISARKLMAHVADRLRQVAEVIR